MKIANILDGKSRRNMVGVHPDLCRVIERAVQISPTAFQVIEGRRTIDRQRELVAKGSSKTLNSRHLTGHAVDLVPIVDGKASWAWPDYYPLAAAFKAAAKECCVKVEWGGDWKSKDGPHWQLPRKAYPDAAPVEVAHEAPAEGKADSLATSRTVAGAGVATAGGVAQMVDPIQSVMAATESAQADLTSGDWVRIAIGCVIVAGALFALYARYDDWKRGRG